MSGNSKNGWNEDNVQPGALNHLLERMNTHFTRFQPGFIPSTTPPWPSHHQTTFTQHNPNSHVMSLDPSINATTLGPHVGINPLRSYSVSQDPFPDMEGVRTPLLRSSSDLGIRLNSFPSHGNSFPDCQLDGIMDHQVESLDGSVFFSENSHPLQNSSPYQPQHHQTQQPHHQPHQQPIHQTHQPHHQSFEPHQSQHQSHHQPQLQQHQLHHQTQHQLPSHQSQHPSLQSHLPLPKSNEMGVNQHMHFPNYLPEHERSSSSMQEEQSNNLATKLSDFTSNLSFTTNLNLGTWLSPLDQLRTNYFSNTGESGDSSASDNRAHECMTDNIQPPITEPNTISQTSTSDSPREAKPPVVTKPSYSDVLSKAPSQEGKSFSSSPPTANKTGSFQASSNAPKSREPSNRSSNKPNKSRNNQGPVRSNSPNINTNNSNNNDFNLNSKNSSKFDSSYSKVGLDDFDIPENTVNYNPNYSTYLNNLNNNSKTCVLENIDKSKKRCSLTPEESSPGHQAKKGNRNEAKRFADKFEESPNSSDVERMHCDKLNNHALSTQQKQTPKRTTYINNNLAPIPVGINASKTNNADSSSNSSLHRRSVPTRDESKLQFDNNGLNTGSSKVSSSNSASSSHVNQSFLSGSASPPGGSSSIRTSGVQSSSRNSRNSNNNKFERSKDALSKKKKGRREIPTYQSEFVNKGWTLFLFWMGVLGGAVLWLLRIIVDVVQMSSRLFVHFSLKFWENGKLHCHETKVAAQAYWFRVLSYFWQRKADNKKGGRNDRKSPSGLENNIPLPTTGEEAMKRLLACRGKDPYSILGVMRSCTDDDIKKYYKRQAFLVHPDKNKQPGAEEAFKILAHAFEIIGEPERREQYDTKLAEEVHLEGATGELASLLNLLKEKLEEAANTIRCTNCNKRHRRVKLPRPIYAARHCAECKIRHAAREGDIWAESWYMGVRWKYFACMEGAIYDISEWAACQRDNLKHLQANTHSVQYRIVSGKKNSGGKSSAPECPTDPELEEFFNNLCRERFGQDFVPGPNQPGSQSSASDTRKRRGKKKK